MKLLFSLFYKQFNNKHEKRNFSFDSSLDKPMKWYQRHIQNPAKHLRWSFLQKYQLF